MSYYKWVRKVFGFTLSTLLLYFMAQLSTQIAYATITSKLDPSPVCQDSKKFTVTFTSDDDDFRSDHVYTLGLWKPEKDPNELDQIEQYNVYSGDPTRQTWSKNINITEDTETKMLGNWHYKLWLGHGTPALNREPNNLIASGEYVMFPKEACTFGLPVLQMPSPVQIGTTVPIKVININPDSDYILWFLYGQEFNDGNFPAQSIRDETIIDKKTGQEKTVKTAYFAVILGDRTGMQTLCLKHGKKWLGFGKDHCEISINIEVTAKAPQVTPTIIQSNEPGISLEESPLFSASTPTPPPPLPQCAEWADINGVPFPTGTNKKQIIPTGTPLKCIAVDTAIGNISTDPFAFVKSVLSLLLSLSGGITVVFIIIAGYRLMTSQGNPEAVKAAQEQLTSAIVGFLFIIFSLVILQVIGVDILKIPGFK